MRTRTRVKFFHRILHLCCCRLVAQRLFYPFNVLLTNDSQLDYLLKRQISKCNVEIRYKSHLVLQSLNWEHLLQNLMFTSMIVRSFNDRDMYQMLCITFCIESFRKLFAWREGESEQKSPKKWKHEWKKRSEWFTLKERFLSMFMHTHSYTVTHNFTE